MHLFKIKSIAIVLTTILSIAAPVAVHANDISLFELNESRITDAPAAPLEAAAVLPVGALPVIVLPVTSSPITKSATAAPAYGVSTTSAPLTRNAIAAPTAAAAPVTHGAPIVQDASTLTAQILAEEVDVWGRIRKGFGIPDLNNALVDSQTRWYASRPDYFQRTTNRASLYLFHVVEELEKRHMPTELALLPFIESAFNPQAYSTAKAAGMWQFIPSTGRDFKLTQNIFRDERRDVIASTDAALNYLQKLYGMFGDWQLALAAYNWGEGSVQRAIKKNRAAGLPTDYSSLSMPLETRNYVPKLQAVKNIIAAPEQYAIVLPKIDNQPYFVTVGKTRDIDIKVAAQLAELSIAEFKALNPQFNRPVITGSASTQILLPQSNAGKFKANLAKWGKALSSWTVHKVTSAREKIETIATRFGTTPAVIREANNIPPKMRLKAGATVMVPKPTETSEVDISDISPETVANATMAIEPDVPPTRRITVKVGKRDNLASIARRNRVSVAQIKTWNNLKVDKLAAGQRLELEVPNRGSRANKKKMARNSQRGQRTKVAAPIRKKGAVAAKTSSNTSKKQRPATALASSK